MISLCISFAEPASYYIKTAMEFQVMTYKQTLQVTRGLVIFIQLMKGKQELAISDMNQKI